MSDARPIHTPASTTAAFAVRHHFKLGTKAARPRCRSSDVQAVISAALPSIARRHRLHLLGVRVEDSCLRALISVQPDQAPSEVARAVKGVLSAELRARMYMHDVWSRGYFFRSNGNETSDVVRRYVAGQYNHHRAAPLDRPEAIELAQFHRREPVAIQKSAHSAHEYNLHIVLATDFRCELLDLEVAEYLIAYWQAVCERKQWILQDVEVLADHAHLFLSPSPADSAQSVALCLMNNSEFVLGNRYGAAMCDLGMSRVWKPGYFAGTSRRCDDGAGEIFPGGAERNRSKMKTLPRSTREFLGVLVWASVGGR